MTESNILALCFVAAAFLTALFHFYGSLLNRIRILEEYAAKLLDEKNVLTLENKRLTGEECRRAVEDFLKRVEAKFQEPNA